MYAVLGNHDHWADAALITDLFRAEGITVLINEGMRFEKNGAAFWLAGVDDTMVGLEDLSLALAGARQRRDETSAGAQSNRSAACRASFS